MIMQTILVDRKGGFWRIPKIERPEIVRLRFFRSSEFPPSVSNIPSDAIISDLLKFGIPEILPSVKKKG